MDKPQGAPLQEASFTFRELDQRHVADWGQGGGPEEASKEADQAVEYFNKIYLEGFQSYRARSGDPPLLPRVWKDGGEEPAAHVAGFERLQEAHARTKPIGLPHDGAGRDGGGASQKGKASHGLVPPRVIVQLWEALGIDSPSGVLPCAPIAEHHIQLDAADEPRRKSRQVEDGRVRLQRGLGLALPAALGSHPVWLSQAEPSAHSALGLRLCSVRAGLQGCGADIGPGLDPLPGPSARPSTGPATTAQARSSAPRPVAVPDKCHAVREVSQIGSHRRKLAAQSASTLQAVRGKPWGDHVGIPPQSRFRGKATVSGYVMDLFAGQGEVPLQCEKLGFFTKQWDIRRGPSHDLTDPTVVRRLVRDIRQQQ